MGERQAGMPASAETDHPVERLLSGSTLKDGYRLSFLANQLVGPVYAGIERDHGLTRPEFLVLFVLAQQDGLTASDIVSLSGLPKNSISRGVQLAERKKLLRRQRDPGDGRRAFLHIEPAGQTLYAELVSRFTDQEARLLMPLNPQEREQLAALLRKMVNASATWIQPI